MATIILKVATDLPLGIVQFMSESEIAKHTVCIARGTEMGHNMQPLIKNVFHQISIIIGIVFISKLENIHEHQQKHDRY